MGEYKPATAYVALGEGGLLKVGMTRCMDHRITTLRKEFIAKGDRALVVHVCDAIEAAYSVERSLIRECRGSYEQHSGREWFVGANFADVAERADALTEQWRAHKYPRPLSEREKRQIEQRYAAARVEGERIRAANQAFHERRARLRMLKRTASERAFSPIVAFALARATPPITSSP